MCKDKIFFVFGCVAILLCFTTLSWATVDISDIPLDAQTKAAPANIMFILDDSGSMDWEFMTIESNGLFSNKFYVFDNPGDHVYSSSNVLDGTQRLMWRSQWFEHNKMYYNPSVVYSHWPTLPDADPDNPRSHPYISGNTFNLSSSYVQSVSTPVSGNIITVDNQDPGFSTLSGAWYESGASPEYDGSSYYSGTSGASARWSISVPNADNYEVWAWWSSYSGWSRDTAAQYVVSHSTGSTTYVRDQNVNFGQWNLLGSHFFNAGTTTIDITRSNNNASADAVRLIQGTSTIIDIPRAHYYVYSVIDSRPYLVTIDAGTISYYAVTVSGSGYTEVVSNLTLVANPPSDVVSSRSYAEERQNFANWYSFYRRRELTATAAVSNVISQMAGVQIGLKSIWNRIHQPVMKIKVDGVDQTNSLLNVLYSSYTSSGGTPLRRGLQDVGEYFHKDDGNDGGVGICPYWSAANGGECQQAFAVLMTDGYWNGTSPGVGNVDGNNGVPFADSYSDTLADVAMYYWENDLSAGLNNMLTPSSADPATYQHMVTYGVSFGVTGSLDPANYDFVTTFPTWPQPNTDPHKIDDLYHSSVNGHGIFLSASDPSDLVSSLLDIMQNIKQRIGSSSSVSVNGDELYKQIDNNTYMFQSSYNTTGWLGDIKAYKVDSTTGAIDLTTPEWSAATVWQGYNWNTYWDTRSIISYDGTAGIPFRLANLTSSQQTLLDSDPATAARILEYVRGDGVNEQSNTTGLGIFRNRASRLSDIVHSSPIYHEGLLFVGANDGMMHVIRAEGATAGSELFSYVPSQVIKNLSLLTQPAYTHKYYVDLTVTVKENVDISGTDKTILVGGLGQGGIGYYALDIGGLTTYNSTTKLWSAPAITETAAQSRVLWEFPNSSTSVADLNDIGYSFSKVLIVETNDSHHPWVVIFGNGYNSADGQSVLFVLDPANGNVLRKFELGANFGTGSNNGLSTPAVTDVGGDGKADYVYAGDLAGNMWKVDLTDTDIANWSVAFTHSGVDAPLFKAVGPTGLSQPITSKPDVMFHPEKDGYLVVFGTGKFLGTSDFLDKSVQTVYGVWDYGDDTDATENLGTFNPATRGVSELSAYSTLLKQELEVPDFTYDPNPSVADDEFIVRVLTDNAITWLTEPDSTSGELPDLSSSANNNAGWYFDLPKSGERIVSRMMIRDGKAIFISFTPEDSPCTPGGDSILHEIDAADGSRMNTPVFDVNGDGIVNTQDVVSITDAQGNTVDVVVSGFQREGHLQTPAILKRGNEEIKYMSSTAGNIETVTETAARAGVSSWREF